MLWQCICSGLPPRRYKHSTGLFVWTLSVQPVGKGVLAAKTLQLSLFNQGTVGALLQFRLLHHLSCTCLQVPSSL